MATQWSEIITAAMSLIDDVRWQEQLALNPAEFFRAKSELLKIALPLLKRPPELLQYLSRGLREPSYDSFEWISDEDSTAEETAVETNRKGFELCSVTVRSQDGLSVERYDAAEYDAETGVVTFPVQNGSGTEYCIDFYTDGEIPEMTYSQKRLLALAIAIVWDEHFERNWLNITPKIKDSSFETVNESNYMEKSADRLAQNRQAFNDELRQYEQACAYTNSVPLAYRGKTLI